MSNKIYPIGIQNCFKIGVNFSAATRNIEKWIVE